MDDSKILVSLAVYQPNLEFLRAQLASLAAQTLPCTLVAVIADGTSHDTVRGMATDLGLTCTLADPPAPPLDPLRAFSFGLETALALSSAPQDLFAFCDQDDVWHPTRLEAARARMIETGAKLVHGDARLVDGSGHLLHASMYAQEARMRNPTLKHLFYRNVITGMASLFDRDVAALMTPIPVPLRKGFFLHDHWLGFVGALWPNGLAHLETPLIDYRQHGGNVVGAATGAEAHPSPFTRAWLRRARFRSAVGVYTARLLRQRLADRGLLKDLSETDTILQRFASPGGGRAAVQDAQEFKRRGHQESARLALGCAAVRMMGGPNQTLLGTSLRLDDETLTRFWTETEIRI